MLSNFDILNLKPEDVYKFLSESNDPGLREVAEDYAKATGLHTSCLDKPTETGYVCSDVVAVLLRLSNILDENGDFVWGANAEICQALFGHRNTGGSFNSKIQDVKAEIKYLWDLLTENTTTTTETPNLGEIAA